MNGAQSCIWCKGRPLPDHDCRNFRHFAPCPTCGRPAARDAVRIWCETCGPENVECPTCNGRGWDLIRPIDNDPTTQCPDCHGTGRVPENVEEP